MRSFVVAITGASGAVYAVRLIEVLQSAGCDVHLSISANAVSVIRQELGLAVEVDDFRPSMLGLNGGLRLKGDAVNVPSPYESRKAAGGRIHYHHYRDLMAPIASGSHRTDGMVVCPCSTSTLSAIVHGMSSNLIHRAAEVHLKEGRKLVLVPRETPLSLVQLGNLHRAAEAGAVILPASPGFYHGARTLQDLVNFIVSRICDQLGVENALIERWGEEVRND